jgi:hypothetical protein
MRVLLLTGWLLLLVLAAAWHYGPGQDYTQLDEVAQVLARADRHAAAAEWQEADDAYEEALRLLPGNRAPEARRIRLERAKAQMLAHKLPAAHQDLKGLLDELQADPAADPRLVAHTRSSLASAQYYMTWLMRLEGEPRDTWEPEIEAARQNYRLLAEDAQGRGDSAAAQRNKEDLEAAIRLARMELSDLQGLPLPSQ